ncbi:hypothetical protein I4F81_010075 [Pyropia yezoensis]|uniref:Uncharacterized protein n=1 Tax=Pyropia yezoensis TaxID=2788 RepID=A0ACC3CBM2_PYRYE|nr:hypothetical protein I4F81_010075 [Neopyropia yezoensis]
MSARDVGDRGGPALPAGPLPLSAPGSPPDRSSAHPATPAMPSPPGSPAGCPPLATPAAAPRASSTDSPLPGTPSAAPPLECPLLPFGRPRRPLRLW